MTAKTTSIIRRSLFAFLLVLPVSVLADSIFDRPSRIPASKLGPELVRRVDAKAAVISNEDARGTPEAVA